MNLWYPVPLANAPRTLSDVRGQAAFVRTLLDEVERLAPPDGASIEEQLVEELARLGCRCIEIANALQAVVERQEQEEDMVRCA